jgi:hypothetical protein
MQKCCIVHSVCSVCSVLSWVVFSPQTKSVQPLLAKGHSRYFGPVRGPHVKKLTRRGICEQFLKCVHDLRKDVAAGRVTQPGGPQVIHPCCNSFLAPSLEIMCYVILSAGGSVMSLGTVTRQIWGQRFLIYRPLKQ